MVESMNLYIKSTDLSSADLSTPSVDFNENFTECSGHQDNSFLFWGQPRPRGLGLSGARTGVQFGARVERLRD